MVVISASKIRGCLTAFLSVSLFLLCPFSLSVSPTQSWLPVVSLPKAPFQALSPASLWIALFTFSLRLIHPLLHHHPAFPHHPSIISLPPPTHSPPPHLSSWPLHPPLRHHAVQRSKLPAEWASWFGQGASQEHWPGTRAAILGGPCPD